MFVFYRNDGDGVYSKGHYSIKPERATIGMPNIILYVYTCFKHTFHITSFYFIVFRSSESKDSYVEEYKLMAIMYVAVLNLSVHLLPSTKLCYELKDFQAWCSSTTWSKVQQIYS